MVNRGPRRLIAKGLQENTTQSTDTSYKWTVNSWFSWLQRHYEVSQVIFLCKRVLSLLILNLKSAKIFGDVVKFLPISSSNLFLIRLISFDCFNKSDRSYDFSILRHTFVILTTASYVNEVGVAIKFFLDPYSLTMY